MLLNTLTTNTLALFALLSPLAAAQDLDTDGLLSRNAQPLDVTLKFYPSNTCAGSGGPERSYSNGACLPLNTDTRGVRILDRRASCHSKSFSFLVISLTSRH